MKIENPSKRNVNIPKRQRNFVYFGLKLANVAIILNNVYRADPLLFRYCRFPSASPSIAPANYFESTSNCLLEDMYRGFKNLSRISPAVLPKESGTDLLFEIGVWPKVSLKLMKIL